MLTPDEKFHGIIEKKNPMDIQVGGDHYKVFAIQPIEFATKNNLGFIQGDVVKQISRYNLPGGKGLQDLQKIKHEIDLLIHLEGWEEKQKTI